MAGLPWIKVWTAAAHHPKVQRLERELRIKDGLGVVIRLWCWTADYCPEGDIPEAEAFAAAKFARGDATRTALDGMLEAFSTVGLLDRVPGGYRVHDWHDMQTRHVEAEEKRRALAAKRQAAYRDRHSNDPGDASRNASRNGDVTPSNAPQIQIQKEREKEIRIPADPINGDRLAGFRSRLGKALGMDIPIPVGKPSAADYFAAQLESIDEDMLLADCVESARRSTTGKPETLSWFVGWLKNLPPPKGAA